MMEQRFQCPISEQKLGMIFARSLQIPNAQRNTPDPTRFDCWGFGGFSDFGGCLSGGSKHAYIAAHSTVSPSSFLKDEGLDLT